MDTSHSIEKLQAGHLLSGFDCGQQDLNSWLTKYALQNQSANSTQTYVGVKGGQIIGFYSLAVGQVEHEAAHDRLRKGLDRHPVPVMLLARLAVDKNWHGKGVGRALLKDAILRTLRAADIAGIRALLIHAKDESARAYYEQFDFVASPSDPLHLFALIKDLRKAVMG